MQNWMSLVAIAAITFAAQAQVVTDGLVLHYDFAAGSRPTADGVVKDLSPNGIDATMRPTHAPGARVARTGWMPHSIRQGDGQGGWVSRPARIQILKADGFGYTMPFGIVQMDNGELVMSCSSGEMGKPGAKCTLVISSDNGATWSDFFQMGGGGRPMVLSYLGGDRLTFVLGPRYYSNDGGRTWGDTVPHPKTKTGMTFHHEGTAWVDRDEKGNATAIHELGWHYTPGKRHPVDDATVVYRRSHDGGKTWIAEVAPPQWKFTMEHKGKKHLRGVSEGSIARAANGDLVAALRTDIPPKYFDGPHDDSLEGTAISISKDNGKTWSEMNFLNWAGKHHANIQRMANGDLVCTVVVRVDCDDKTHTLASYRRGMDAWVSRDNGQTWNTDQRYELHAYNYARHDGYWVDGKCGHIGAVALKNGKMISAYSHYQMGAVVLVEWDPSSNATVDAASQSAEPWNPKPKGADAFHSIAQPVKDYTAGPDGLHLGGAAWVHIPTDDRLMQLNNGTIEVVLEPKNKGDMPMLLTCRGLHRDRNVWGFSIGYDLRSDTNTQRIYSDQRVHVENGEYSIQIASPNTPKAFKQTLHQLAYVVKDGHGAFYRDGLPFKTTRETGKDGSLFKYVHDKTGGNKDGVHIALGGRPQGDATVSTPLHGRFVALRIYDRALTTDELTRNRRTTLK